MKKKPTQSRERGQGGIPLAGSRGGAPLWGLGQRPNRFTGDHSKGTTNKGAGSEASLPVTLRVLRRAPKLLFPTSMLCRARWARPNCWSFRHSCAVNQECFFPNAGISPLRRRQGGFAVAPLTPSHCTPMLLDFYCSRGISPLRRRPKGMKTDEVCDRPLETFGAATFGVSRGWF